ncbi:hypothetical protein OIU74_002363 [Salix koriyanagi]|uniref:Uncharacterized protein n=1 Tax=Salix koriyanagi TaxID=2511006 RepID=A0A9Q1APJ5_9ROSI|nr:hypothetical protein OIU74_002363 [Salix koriyanagi]
MPENNTPQNDGLVLSSSNPEIMLPQVTVGGNDEHFDIQQACVSPPLIPWKTPISEGQADSEVHRFPRWKKVEANYEAEVVVE